MCRPIWRRSGVMPEEMGKLREKGIQKAVWKGMHNNTYVFLIYESTQTG